MYLCKFSATKVQVCAHTRCTHDPDQRSDCLMSGVPRTLRTPVAAHTSVVMTSPDHLPDALHCPRCLTPHVLCQSDCDPFAHQCSLCQHIFSGFNYFAQHSRSSRSAGCTHKVPEVHDKIQLSRGRPRGARSCIEVYAGCGQLSVQLKKGAS